MSETEEEKLTNNRHIVKGNPHILFYFLHVPCLSANIHHPIPLQMWHFWGVYVCFEKLLSQAIDALDHCPIVIYADDVFLGYFSQQEHPFASYRSHDVII